MVVSGRSSWAESCLSLENDAFYDGARSPIRNRLTPGLKRPILSVSCRRGGGAARGGRARARVQGGRRVRAAARGHAAPRAPGQRAQVHGYLPAPAHLLQPLPRVHLVSAGSSCYRLVKGICIRATPDCEYRPASTDMIIFVPNCNVCLCI